MIMEIEIVNSNKVIDLLNVDDFIILNNKIVILQILHKNSFLSDNCVNQNEFLKSSENFTISIELPYLDPSNKLNNNYDEHRENFKKFMSEFCPKYNMTGDTPMELMKSTRYHYIRKEIEELLFNQCLPQNIDEIERIVTQPQLRDNIINLKLCNLGLESLPVFVFELSNLESLFLNINFIKKIKVGITKLTNLKMLSLVDNRIYDLPEFLTKLSKLEFLDASCNPVHASLPDWVNFQILNN